MGPICTLSLKNYLNDANVSASSVTLSPRGKKQNKTRVLPEKVKVYFFAGHLPTSGYIQIECHRDIRRGITFTCAYLPVFVCFMQTWVLNANCLPVWERRSDKDGVRRAMQTCCLRLLGSKLTAGFKKTTIFFHSRRV